MFDKGGWLVGCFGFNGSLRQYFSLYRGVSQREGEREEKRIDESKNVQTTPTRTYYKRSRPLPYCNPNCRTPRHWKFTLHHRTTRPPPTKAVFCLVLLANKGPLQSFYNPFCRSPKTGSSPFGSGTFYRVISAADFNGYIIQSTLVISKSKRPSEILRNIRTSTYQMCRTEENTNRTTKFHK